MKVLVINSGSSSIKYQVFHMTDSSVLASGMVEQIGEAGSRIRHSWFNSSGMYKEIDRKQNAADHRSGFDLIFSVTASSGIFKDAKELAGIGHRVVHGGEAFQEPAIISDNIVNNIRKMIPLAPIHNPANLIGIEVLLERYPDVPQVAVFDTAFHQTIPPVAYHYALPQYLYKEHYVRRYGFHGTSHHYVAKEAAAYLNRPLEELNLITLHLGNGASAAAIKSGKCIDTSMGMTPLEGLIMGTRCGDLDPAIHFYISRSTGKTIDEIESLLNKDSGLKGICGVNDMRMIMQLSEKGELSAQLAIEMYCYRIKKYIGAYSAVLGYTDAIVFTGGIGENAALIRELSCRGVENLGIKVNEKKNNDSSGRLYEIQDDQGAVKVLVIATNEELEIARQTMIKILPEFTINNK